MAVFTAAEAFEIAMEIEENGEVFYNEVSAKSDDEEVRELFKSMAAQERAHYHTFKKLLDEAKPAPDLSAEEYDQYQTYAETALENALFAGPEKALSLAKKAEDRETALRAAMGFEKDTLLFFYDLREMVSDADKEAVSNIIGEEKKHLRRLASKL